MEHEIHLQVIRAGARHAHRPNTAAARIILGLMVALALVLAFTRLVNLASVFERLDHLSIAPAALCGVAFLSAYSVRALRWRRLLGGRGITRRRVIAVYQVAIFVNWLLPLRGGELVKSVLLRRLNAIPISESLPTVAMDKSMDLMPAIGLLLLLPFVPFHLSRPLWVLLITVLAFLVAVALFLGLAAVRRHIALALLACLTARLPVPLRRRVEPFSTQFVDALLALIVQPRLLLVATAYTAVAVCLDAAFCFLAFQAVGERVALPVILYGYTFYNLAYMLPTPPGQIGSNELIGLVVFSGLFQLNRSAVAAMFLFSHPWTALLMAGSGLVSLGVIGVGVRPMLALARQPAEGNSAR